ncbi:EAL domain-containing protein [Pseudoxanthomonas daejeonensis]|uniref:EAL domain-containing protein n=1 Tax=Pseudoxanthomonas daejeonensis TaxID=266062 RepID=UPI001F53E6BE|nr:EAL domain-containing protein [Pseudoxanthomonas daejeonensis]UNK57264.1 EAL domain-containing protein [Pseudoxanthomonas daejeonensis]
MQQWTRRNTRDAILIAALCFGLPLLAIPYWPGFGTGATASLAHLQWGVLLALAMLSPHKLYFRIGYLSLFLAWCVRLLLREDDSGTWELLLRSLPLYAAMYGWTVLCAHWMGWPRPPGKNRIRQRDIVPYGAIALVLYPLGWALGHALVNGLFSEVAPPNLLDQTLQVGFARFFGVLCLTLPIVLFFTGRNEPAPMPSRMFWWEWVLLGGYSMLLTALLWALPGSSQHPLGGLLDQRFMLAALMVWAVLRLPWRWSAPLIAAVTLLLVYLVGAGTRVGLRSDALHLLQIGFEMSVLQQLMVLTQVIARDNRRAIARLAEESRRDGLSGVPNINALRHDLTHGGQPPAEIGCLGIEHLDNLMAGYGLPAQEALTASIHDFLQPDVQAYTLGMGRFALVPTRADMSWKALLARIEQFEFNYAEAQVRIEPHLGVCPLRDASAQSLELALDASYGAMQAARQRGETAPVFATPGLSDPAALRAMLETHSLALSLLRRRKIELHVQPIRRLSATTAQMGEILCRLRSDDGRLLMPRDYMDELDASRGEVELDRAVIETLLTWMRDNSHQLPYPRLTVNLTGRSLVSENFRNWLLYQLDVFPGCAERLCFEITERAITGGLVQVRPLLDGLSQRGCLIALDDFGTGMQSFERLQQLPIDLVKIDGTFVRNVASNPRDRDLVRAMVTIARAYQAETIAEYVEDAAILAVLEELQVDWIQGYHIGRPQPLDSLPSLAGSSP